MKKFRLAALALAGALSFTLLAACSGGGEAAPETTPPASTEPVESAEPTEPVEPTVIPDPSPEATEPAAGEESPAPDGGTPADPGSSGPSRPETPESSQPPAQTPQASPSQEPSAEPSQEPEPSEAPGSSVVQSVWNDIAALDIPSLADVDAATLTALYGIDSADLEEYVCKIPLMNVQATEFFIAQVKDGRMDAVKAGVEARQADLEAQWSQYLPDQLELVEGYQLVINGNYILFAISEYASDAVSVFNSYTK